MSLFEYVASLLCPTFLIGVLIERAYLNCVLMCAMNQSKPAQPITARAGEKSSLIIDIIIPFIFIIVQRKALFPWD